jgi:mono/diheme cytochrome c family protein
MGCRTILCALAIVMASASASIAQLPFGSAGQEPVAGSRVFGAKGCVKCHQVNGLGGKVGPDLGRVAQPRSFYDLAASLWNHAPKMADRMHQLGIARPRLDSREAGDLVAFLFTLDYFEGRGNLEAGRRLFVDKRCIVCHQIGGTGGVIGPRLDSLKVSGSPIYVAAEMWNHGPQMAEMMKAQGVSRPTFKDSELGDLIAYIRSTSKETPEGPLYVLPGRADEGRRLFSEKRCIECHSVGGQGGRVGPDLADRGVHASVTRLATAMWNKAPRMLEAMKSRDIPVPQLRPAEMADIVAYLYAVRYFARPGDPRAGLIVATSKGCFGCHALRGERGKVASDLAEARDIESPAAVLSALWNHSFIADPNLRAKAAWSEIKSDEMANLVAFLQSLRPAR